MTVSDAQVRKLMSELRKTDNLKKSAMKAGMDRGTGRRYRSSGKLPSQTPRARNWKTRSFPFAEDWAEVVRMMTDAPEFEVLTVFEFLQKKTPGRYEEGQLRTLQRAVRRWRASEGPEREVFFPQEHRPGEALQTDGTCGNELGITILGEAFPHLLCHSVLPYSNWEYVNVCHSESMLVLRGCIQGAVLELGHAPTYSQTDNSTAATHEVPGGGRGFNVEYVAFLKHFGMKPRTIKVGKSEQDGDVEALNGALKRRIKQHLLLRGSRDFPSQEAYEAWVKEVVNEANAKRTEKLAEELRVMPVVQVDGLSAYKEGRVPVSRWSTIRWAHNGYSVPSRLINEEVLVRAYESRIEVWFGGALQLSTERLLGRGRHKIDYRHIIWSLVKKPGAFARYRYREELFPSLVFRKAYDTLTQDGCTLKAELAYLRLLLLAASTMESDVQAALELLLDAGEAPTEPRVKELMALAQRVPPLMTPFQVDLASYDSLLSKEILG